MSIKKFAITAMAAACVGCASQPEDISANYVSPQEYRGHTCQQLADESMALNASGRQLYNKLDNEADGDAAQMAVGMLLFWPALFFLEGGDGADAEVYSDLKGRMNAVQQVAREMGCVGVPAPVFAFAFSEAGVG